MLPHSDRVCCSCEQPEGNQCRSWRGRAVRDKTATAEGSNVFRLDALDRVCCHFPLFVLNKVGALCARHVGKTRASATARYCDEGCGRDVWQLQHIASVTRRQRSRRAVRAFSHDACEQDSAMTHLFLLPTFSFLPTPTRPFPGTSFAVRRLFPCVLPGAFPAGCLSCGCLSCGCLSCGCLSCGCLSCGVPFLRVPFGVPFLRVPFLQVPFLVAGAFPAGTFPAGCLSCGVPFLRVPFLRVPFLRVPFLVAGGLSFGVPFLVPGVCLFLVTGVCLSSFLAGDCSLFLVGAFLCSW